MKRRFAVSFGPTLPILMMIICGASIATSQTEADATGIWKWTFPGPRGGAPVEATLNLKQQRDKLTGRVSRAGEERSIEQGKIVGDHVSFQVTWFRAGQANATRYEGKLSGDRIMGTITSSYSGSLRTINWDAKRIK